jgi:hypothetical protein
MEVCEQLRAAVGFITGNNQNVTAEWLLLPSYSADFWFGSRPVNAE